MLKQPDGWLTNKPDPERPISGKPGPEELLVERTGLSSGIALIWTAVLEFEVARASDDHPHVAERIFTIAENLSLRNDSAARQLLGDFIKAWLDPENDWGDGSAYENPDAAFADALNHLVQHMRDLRR